MDEKYASAYQTGIRKRIIDIMNMIGLEKSGFSELTQISNSHLYALLNGTRGITDDTASKIALSLKITSSQFLNLDYVITDIIKKAPAVKEFYKVYKDNPEYFTGTKVLRKKSYIIENELLRNGVFKEGSTVSEIKDVCLDHGVELTSKEVSQYLDYLAVTKKLKKEKRLMIKKNGELGNREITVYSQEDQNKGITDL